MIQKKQCNFSLIGGNATGTYQLQMRFSSITYMPAETKKAENLTLKNCENTFAYLDDVLTVTEGSKDTDRKPKRRMFSKS